VADFYAKFQIQSSTPATINGVKAEIPPETIGAPPGATCQGYALVNYGYSTIGNAQPNQYGATISRDGQTFSDKGSTDVLFLPVGPCGVGGCGAFHESFTSSQGALLSPSEGGDS
jgi:hypothetical protein